VGAGDILGEDRAGQAEFGGIGAFDDFGLVGERQDGHDRAEDFLRTMAMSSVQAAKIVGATNAPLSQPLARRGARR
jgi:hypothetical protein